MRPGGLVAITVATLLTMATIFSLAAYQVTTEGAATRLLSRLAASMFEVDRWLPAHQDDLELVARDRPDSFVRVDLPIAVNLPARAVIDADTRQLRSRIVSEMGSILYRRGN